MNGLNNFFNRLFFICSCKNKPSKNLLTDYKKMNKLHE